MIATLAIILAGLIVWYAQTVFLLAFAGVLVAIILYTISSVVSELLGARYSVVLGIVVLGLAAFLVAVFWIATPLIASQLKELIVQVPEAYQEVKEYIVGKGVISSESLSNTFILKNEKFIEQATQIFSYTLEIVTGSVFIVFLGIYLAVKPHEYIEGFILLFPERKRRKISDVIWGLGQTLQWWLLGKFISMAVIGLLSLIALWILGVPLAFILALIAALFAFIPYIGSILAAVPAILVALSISPWIGLYTTLAYLLIHGVDGYLVTPLVEQRTVSLPPTLTVMMQVLLTLLIGFLGLALASPITVVALVLVRELYINNKR